MNNFWRCRRYNSWIRRAICHDCVHLNCIGDFDANLDHLDYLADFLTNDIRHACKLEFGVGERTHRDSLSRLARGLPHGWGLTFRNPNFTPELGACIFAARTSKGFAVKRSPWKKIWDNTFVPEMVGVGSVEEVADEIYRNRIEKTDDSNNTNLFQLSVHNDAHMSIMKKAEEDHRKLEGELRYARSKIDA